MAFTRIALRALALVVSPALLLAQAANERPPVDFSSVVFGNFQYRFDSAAKLATGGKPTTRFDVGRAYLTFRFPTGERASVRITADVFPQTGGLPVRLKYGYLQYDATKKLLGVDGLGAVARIGMLHTVVIDHIETFWPRWLGNSAVETHGFFSSADIGAASLVTFPKRRGEVYLHVVNGPGYTASESDRFKDVAARFSFTPFGNDSGFFRTFTITPWYYKGWNASAIAQTAQISDGLQKDRRGIFVGVRDRRLTLTAEFDQRVEELETVLTPTTRTLRDRTSKLVSALAIIRPVELFDASKRSRFSLIGRYDDFQIDTDANPKTNVQILGALWDLTSRVTLALDYQGTTPRNVPSPVPTKAWFLHWVATF